MEKRGHRTAFLKEVVIGFGFLTGMWLHLGFDPQSFVFAWLQKILLSADPAHKQWITLFFFGFPILLTVSSALGAFKRGGFFGIIAVALAFAAGYLLNIASLGLLAGAVIIGFFSARKK